MEIINNGENANKRQWEMTDWSIIDNDEWRNLMNDEYKMSNSGVGQTIGTDRQWEMTTNGEWQTMAV